MSDVKLINGDTFRQKLGGISRATLWRWSKADKDFPKPIFICGHQNRYLEKEADDYILLKVAERGAMIKSF